MEGGAVDVWGPPLPAFCKQVNSTKLKIVAQFSAKLAQFFDTISKSKFTMRGRGSWGLVPHLGNMSTARRSENSLLLFFSLSDFHFLTR